VLTGVPLTLDPTKAVLAAAHAEAVDAVVEYRADLLPPQRFVADHQGEPDWSRTADQQREWEVLLSRCEVVLGVPGDSPDGLRDLVAAAPQLRWIQGTAAELERITVTSATGAHAVPLGRWRGSPRPSGST
jgi:hypothetical protein